MNYSYPFESSQLAEYYIPQTGAGGSVTLEELLKRVPHPRGFLGKVVLTR